MGQGAGVRRRPRAPHVLDGLENVSDYVAQAVSPTNDAQGAQARRYDLAREEAREAESSVSSVKIRCQRCSSVWEVPCGTTALSCGMCGARIMIALATVSQQASEKAAGRLAAARAELRTILEEQAAICQGLWEKLEEEVGLAQAMWRSRAQQGDLSSEAIGHAHALLAEATAARDGAQVAEALAHASEAALPPPGPEVAETLARLRSEEDLEVLWRCFLRAMEAEDCIDLEFWCEEAAAQGLCVPSEVQLAVGALRAAERARLAELEYAWSLDARVAQAHSTGDTATLQQLVQEAESLGADASSAQAALTALRSDMAAARSSASSATAASSRSDTAPPSGASATAADPPPQAAREDGRSSPSRPASASRAAAPDVANMSAEELRQLGVPALKAELARRGVDCNGLYEKEELVHVLLVVLGRSEGRGSPQAPPRAGATPSSSSRPPEEPRQRPRPDPQPQAQGLPKEWLEGTWFRSNGTTIVIDGLTVTFQDGTVTRIQPQGGDKFSMPLEGSVYSAQLFKGRIVWSDGDLWTRVPPKPRPQRPRPGGGGAAGAQRPPPPEQPGAAARARGPMTRAQALACLGLSGDPSQEELRRAYKQAALRWHPDRRQNHDCAEEAKERFQEVRAAFDYLQPAAR